jgi:hypothetical protein
MASMLPAQGVSGWTAEKGQASALQRFAIAAAERRRALEDVRRAERDMAREQKEACRLGNLRFPVTTTLLTGQIVTIDHPRQGDPFFAVTFSRPLRPGVPDA